MNQCKFKQYSIRKDQNKYIKISLLNCKCIFGTNFSSCFKKLFLVLYFSKKWEEMVINLTSNIVPQLLLVQIISPHLVTLSYFCFLGGYMGFPQLVKESTCNAGDPGSIPGSGRFPWRRKWQPSPVSLPGKSHGQRSLVGYSPRGCKQSDTTE